LQIGFLFLFPNGKTFYDNSTTATLHAAAQIPTNAHVVTTTTTTGSTSITCTCSIEVNSHMLDYAMKTLEDALKTLEDTRKMLEDAMKTFEDAMKML
jgi:hypothetical protein